MFSLFKSFVFDLQRRMPNDGITADEIEIMARRDRFSKYLPYRIFDPDEHCYYNVDDTFGFLWELSPLVYANKETYDGIEQIMNNVPFGTTIQAIIYADPYIDPLIDQYLAARKMESQMAVRTASLFLEASRKGFKQAANIPARNFRSFLAVKFPPKKAFDNEARFLRDQINEVLKGAGLLPRYMAPQALCSWLQFIFNNRSDIPKPGVWKYDAFVPINRQIIMKGTHTNFEFNQFHLGSEKIAKVQSISGYPLESLDDHTINKALGGIWGSRDDGNQYTFPFLLSVNVFVENLRPLFHAKTNVAMYQEKQGSMAAHKMDRQEELSWAARETDRGKRFVRVIPSIVTFSKTEKESNENTARVKRIWGNNGFSVSLDRGICMPMFLLSLPFGLYGTRNNIEFLQRDRIMSTESAARFLPIQGDFSGYGKPVTLLKGRKGQVVTLDMFHPDSPNNNALIAASTGSGKSYLMNRLLTDLNDTGAKLRIFDLGRSYEKLCSVKKGNFLFFGKESQVSVNPFSTVRDINEEIGILSLIISQMVWSSSKDKPTETQMSVIKAAVRQAWDDEGPEGEADHVRNHLTDFDNCLKKQCIEVREARSRIKDIASELAFNLQDFTGAGAYSRWFKGKSTLDIENENFVVLELEELMAMEELFNVVIMQMVNYVTQNLYLSNRESPRMIVYDEAWKWFKEGSFLGEVIENGYRLARKYYGGFITIFQSLLDLRKFGKSGDVINDQSAFKFCLMSKTKYNRAVEEKLLDVDGFMLEIANSVRLEKGRYSEILLQTPDNIGVVRLPSDPYSHLVFTSDPRDNLKIKNYAKEHGVSIMDAIERIADGNL